MLVAMEAKITLVVEVADMRVLLLPQMMVAQMVVWGRILLC
jgi:hypothetical protein